MGVCKSVLQQTSSTMVGAAMLVYSPVTQYVVPALPSASSAAPGPEGRVQFS